MRSIRRTAAALALVTAAGCASPPAPTPERPSPAGGYSSLGLADVPAAPRRDPPKTLSASDSRGLASLVEIAAAFVNCR